MGKVRFNPPRGAVPCKNVGFGITLRPIEMARLTWAEIEIALERGGYSDNKCVGWRDISCRCVKVDENGGNAQATYDFAFNESADEWASGEVYISVVAGHLYGEY